MSIQSDIKQNKPFRNEHHELVVNIIYTYNWLVDQIKQKLKPFNITLQQFNVLRILRGAGEPVSTSVIRERMLDKMSDTSRIVDRLYQKGLVKRTTCSSDKRLVDISLTREGEELLVKMDNVNNDMDAIAASLCPEEAKSLSRLMDKLRNIEACAENVGNRAEE